MMAAALEMPFRPFGAKGVQFSGRTYMAPSTRKKRTMPSFPMTSAVLKRAVSRMPMSTIHVTSMTMPKAGRLKISGQPNSRGAVCQASSVV